jgi:PLP dependent protein
MTSKTIQENVKRVLERIAAATQRAGRRSEEITLVAISKTHPAEAIRAAYEAGIKHFGENRVQEWEGKRDAVADLNATWHLVGHLQSNKAAHAASVFDCVDSVHEASLAQRLNRAREELNVAQKLRVLIEVRLAPEASKIGVEVEGVPGLAEGIFNFAHLELAGLMCIPPYLESPEQVRPYFHRLRKLRDDFERRLVCKFPVLSMGMSHDFEVAIEEGATEVRIGTAIFGARSAE